MAISKTFLRKALLGYNYLPAQRRKLEEMPPIFDSKTFTQQAAASLLQMRAKGKGFDVVEYRTTKFNSVSRPYSIPHPVAYAQLTECIVSNWTEIQAFQSSNVSMIRPRRHNDGRIIIMDYESFGSRARRSRKIAFGQRYVARTDVASCFPSVYTHAIPWAAVGLTAAKKNTREGWHNKLDAAARRTIRDETLGIPVGPGTSNIIAELILGKVDQSLADEFRYGGQSPINGMSRFIDDYTFYCDSYDEAERFIRRLGEELSTYKMRLNPKKTTITNVIAPFSDAWAVELSLRIPSTDEVNGYQAINYLEYASSLAQKFPEGSVLKYAASALLNKPLRADAKLAVLDYLLVLAVEHPVLLPVLEDLFEATPMHFDEMRFEDRMQVIVQASAVRHRSDGMAWGLYYLKKYGGAVPNAVAKAVLDSRDCIGILMLFSAGRHVSKVVTWAKSLDKQDPYELDRYWILLYQLFLADRISENFCSVPAAFTELEEAGVSFLRPIP